MARRVRLEQEALWDKRVFADVVFVLHVVIRSAWPEFNDRKQI